MLPSGKENQMFGNIAKCGVAVLLLAAAPLAATGADEKFSSATDDKEQVTCKYTKVLGSRIPQKVCMTDVEWEERRRVQMENKRSSRNNNSSCGSGKC